LNVGVDGTELAGGSGPLFPFGLQGVLAALPFAVWLYLAIEELPLAAEESVDPRRDMPRGILLALATLTVTAFLIAAINPAVNGVGAYKLGTSGEPILDGLRALYGNAGAIPLGLIALSGLIASFHAIIFGLGRQIFALSRSGYFPAALSRTHTVHKTPHVALLTGSALGLAIMMTLGFVPPSSRSQRSRCSISCRTRIFPRAFSGSSCGSRPRAPISRSTDAIA
jgi:ethanolamine permease